MLTTLVIFNSQKHAKAIIRLDDATAIQVIGENKIGKTTLIDSLNFLYIIDKNKMSFDSRGGKSTYSFKESLHHFFPKTDQSFIIFECFKGSAGGYFCVLVKRKTLNDDVEYFRINKRFEESDFIDASDTLKSFQQIRKELSISEQIEQLKDKRAFFECVYSQDKRRNAFLWVSDKVKRKGQALENSLTKTYRFLLNASAINDNALKEALLIADNRQDLSLNIFANRNRIEKVKELQEAQRYIQKLTSIKKEFEDFKRIVNATKLKEKQVAVLLYSFDVLYKEKVKLLKSQIEQIEITTENYNKEIKVFKPQRSKLDQELGELKGEIKRFNEDIHKKKEEHNEINQILAETSALHPTVETLTDFLRSEQKSLQEQLSKISSVLQTIEQYNFTAKHVTQKIKSIEEKQQQTARKIEKYQDLLIHNISDQVEIREKLNAFFSDEFTANLTKENIQKKVESLNEVLYLNEGEIQGLDQIPPKPLESIEELKLGLEGFNNELKQQKDILSTIQNREEKEAEQAVLNKKVEGIETKIRKISRKEEVESEITELKNHLESKKGERTQKEEQRDKILEELNKVERLIKVENDKVIDCKSQIATYKNWYNEFEEELHQMREEQEISRQLLETLHKKLHQEKKSLKQQKDTKKEKLRDLQGKTGNDAAESLFIEQIEAEMQTVMNREKSIETLLEQVSNEFTKPTADFLRKYTDFEVFVKRFNKNISQYTISDLSAVKIRLELHEKLHQDLEKISKIIKVEENVGGSLFETLESKEQQEYLKVLEKYILERNRDIPFKNLFEVTLEAYDENGKRKKIDLKAGNESQGTIRMINLILFLSVIKYFMRTDEENKLVFFIDEDVIDRNNTEQLIRFCKENGFIVIFAAKHQIVGLEKYYLLFKSAAHQNKVYVKEPRVIEATKK